MTTVAIAGSGHVAALYALATRELGWQVTALAERPGRNGEERARQIGVPLCNVSDLSGGADIVIVATDHRNRAADALRLVDSGAIVIVDAPMGATLLDAEMLVDAAQTDLSRVRCGMNLLFAPVIVSAVDAVRRIGPLTHMEVRAFQGRPHWDDSPEVARVGGVIFELAIQPIALALKAACAAAPTRVMSVSARTQAGTDPQFESQATIAVQFDSGLTATIHVEWDEAAPTWDFQAASNNGVVRAELLPEPLLEVNGDPIDIGPTRRSPSNPPQLGQLGYVAQLEHGFEPDSLKLGLQAMEVMMAAYLSASQQGESVSIPFTGPHHKTPSEFSEP